MSALDLSDKSLYDMINNNNRITEKNPMMEMRMQKEAEIMPELSSQSEVMPELSQQPQLLLEPEVIPETIPKKKSFKIVRSLKSFVIFVIAVALIAAFIYFTIYRLGWGVKECMNKNYHDCAALLTPEMAPLAATGLLALI
jgi:hypothetical protein